MPLRPPLVRGPLTVAALALLGPAAAGGGSISISTEVVATAREGTLAVTLNITNSADEAAMSVAALSGYRLGRAGSAGRRAYAACAKR